MSDLETYYEKDDYTGKFENGTRY